MALTTATAEETVPRLLTIGIEYFVGCDLSQRIYGVLYPYRQVKKITVRGTKM
jgi:hypothetical protein